MCGIAGIVGYNKSGTTVHSMLEKIAHRGPDGLFYWNGENVAFGHARLSIIDLSQAANQPMIDPLTGNVIIFNGEIFNYIELKEQFKNDYQFKTNSDTEVILAAYQLYGVGMFSRLRGMFAFALYDAHLKKVMIARDRMGIKPLFYRKINQAFYFGSEMKSVTQFHGISDNLNELKVYEFLADARMDADEYSMFEGVMHLPPAHYMWINQNGEDSKPLSYWDFPQLGKRKFDENAKHEFIVQMDETIKMHLRSDVPVGAFLSGGLDSSSVVCFALKHLKQNQLNVFSAILPYYHPENSLIKEITSIDINVDISKLIDDVNQLLIITAGNLLSLPSFLKGLNVSLKYYWENESATNSSFYKTKDEKDEPVYIKFEYNKQITKKRGALGFFRMNGTSNKEYLNIVYFIAKPKNDAAEKICSDLMNITIQSIVNKIKK